MKNWKTTIVGAVIGGLVAIQPILESGQINVQELLIGFLIAAFGAVSKDFNVTGTGK